VPLIRHGGRPNLFGLERFFHFLPVRQQPQVGTKLMSRFGYSRQCGNDLTVDFAGVGLSGYGVNAVESHFLRDQLIQPLDLFVVSPEQRQETGLCPRGSFDATKPMLVQPALDLSQVQNKVITPQGCSFADSDQLSRLKMSKSQR